MARSRGRAGSGRDGFWGLQARLLALMICQAATRETISVSWKRRLRNSGVVVPLALAPSEPKSHSACSAMAGNRAPFAILTT